MEEPAASRAGSDRRSWGCPEQSESRVCLEPAMLVCWHLPAAAFPWSRASRDLHGPGSSWGAGMLPLGTCLRHSPGWGTRQGEELFKSKRSQSPRPGERFLLGLAGLPGMCVLFLQEIPSESPAGVSRATGACGSAPPARIVPAPLCWPLYCHRHHRHGQHSLRLSPLGGCTPGSPLCVPSLGGTMDSSSSCPQGCPVSLSLLSLSGASPREPVIVICPW